MPKANYGSKKNTTFKIWLAFSVKDPENPEPISAVDGVAGLWQEIRELGSPSVEFHFCEFARPGWHLDAYLREMALIGEGLRVNSRVINQDRLIELRLRYLLRGTSLIETPLTTINTPDGHISLSDQSWGLVSDLSPIILRMFGLTAAQILDLAVNPNTYMDEECFKFFAEHDFTDENLQKFQEFRQPKTSVDEDEAKKKSGS